jgi:hypothetical protein
MTKNSTKAPISPLPPAYWRALLDDSMAAIARLAAVSLDSSDPVGLATFYRPLLDLEMFRESEDFVALKGAGILITTQRVEAH